MIDEKQMEKRNVATQRRDASDPTEDEALRMAASAFDEAERVNGEIKRASTPDATAVAADEAADEDTLH